MVGSASRTGLALGGLAVGVYYFTIYHLKQQAPGNLDEMVRLCVTSSTSKQMLLFPSSHPNSHNSYFIQI